MATIFGTAKGIWILRLFSSWIPSRVALTRCGFLRAKQRTMGWISVQMAQPLYALGEENSAFKKK